VLLLLLREDTIDYKVINVQNFKHNMQTVTRLNCSLSKNWNLAHKFDVTLEANFNIMHYINPCFTYFTYLLTFVHWCSILTTLWDEACCAGCTGTGLTAADEVHVFCRGFDCTVGCDWCWVGCFWTYCCCCCCWKCLSSSMSSRIRCSFSSRFCRSRSSICWRRNSFVTHRDTDH